MAHGFSPQSRKSGAYQQGQEGVGLDVLEDYASSANYNLWIPACDLVEVEGTTVALSDTDGTPHRVLVEGDTSVVGFSFRRPRWWINGRVTARTYYTGPASGGSPADTFDCDLSVRAISEGDALSAPSYDPFDLPDPVGLLVIDRQPERSNGSNSFPVVRLHTDFITVNFRRNGASINDSHDGDLHLLGLEIAYKEIPGSESLNLASDFRHWSAS